jgi:hypothetical protein
MNKPLQAEQKLLGLIKPGHPAGGSRGGKDWDLIFHLVAWRTAGGEVHQGRLRCLMSVGDKAFLDAWYPVVPGLGLVQVDVVRQEGQTLLVKHVSVLDSDAKLEVVRQSLQKPVVLDDAELGHMTLDRSLDIYEGNAQWGDRPIRLILSADVPEQPGVVLNAAKSFLRAQTRWDTLIREVAVSKLLPLKNDVWLEEGEEPVTSEAFLKRMAPNTLEIIEQGDWSLWFDDNDMFWGHAITIRGRTDSNEVEASLAG